MSTETRKVCECGRIATIRRATANMCQRCSDLDHYRDRRQYDGIRRRIEGASVHVFSWPTFSRQ